MDQAKTQVPVHVTVTSHIEKGLSSAMIFTKQSLLNSARKKVLLKYTNQNV